MKNVGVGFGIGSGSGVKKRVGIKSGSQKQSRHNMLLLSCHNHGMPCMIYVMISKPVRYIDIVIDIDISIWEYRYRYIEKQNPIFQYLSLKRFDEIARNS